MMGGTCTFPADFRTVGKVIRFKLQGSYTTTGAANFTYSVTLGATAIQLVSTVNVDSLNPSLWEIEGTITTRTIDAVGPTTGTHMWQTVFRLYNLDTGVVVALPLTSTAATTLTTTADQNLDIAVAVNAGISTIFSTNTVVTVGN